MRETPLLLNTAKKNPLADKWNFGHFLVVLEIVWIVFYIGIGIATFVVTGGAFFMDPLMLGYGSGNDIRSDFFSLGTHILTSATLVALLAGYKRNWRPSGWSVFFFLFLLYRDVYQLTEMAHFSRVSSFGVTQGLWVAGIVIAAYQVVLTVAMGIWALASLMK
jgi:hypothetical protein